MNKFNWVKWNTQIPPTDGTTIIIAMRNKNMGPDGIWLYDICCYYGGDPDNKDNWDGKWNWETPIYWSYIPKPEI